MPRRSFDHTGDVGVDLTASTLAGLFAEAALAFTDTVTDLEAVRVSEDVDVAAAAGSLDDLMVEWLSEILFRFEVARLLVAHAGVRVDRTSDGWALAATVKGETFEPGRHPLRVPVKGITYHRLAIREEDGEWRTSVVFDI